MSGIGSGTRPGRRNAPEGPESQDEQLLEIGVQLGRILEARQVLVQLLMASSRRRSSGDAAERATFDTLLEELDHRQERLLARLAGLSPVGGPHRQRHSPPDAPDGGDAASGPLPDAGRRRRRDLAA